ncbi:TauD/TfdA dioxygenase family protein [Umezakia ovalisporum]|jgi:taurine dioxygenase|uniref:TauD/TfdA family dioxygenase n=2 Tax=Umezakia ovalisporum TaxID=75695 RepID=A0AA43KG61_9CYAN|nr:TauD/TfdA family dioxygenase [Umezakia ovalisporum]MBI1243318.1 TauD/TfdA family dioxygenase [Nostoc sp. RI_552]MDH6058277.1 TauD/TfdA family dioxygenase [Umezakia ovalisporum FSS-43]MDH6065669.1 TauD/TfdA family dioxygenase [Umezakia ovalisporum FSS-62]MDH6068547.1 TauD/TfdA family dioxygenase [Umezakia ovalisporum APH033B]MDH6071366.1 TauD/TfdA family dioxygenase [Umezakia ovalisporum CobakiLakeA]
MQFHPRPEYSRLGIEVLPKSNVTEITDDEITCLKNALWHHGVVVVKNQHLTASQLKKFADKTFSKINFDYPSQQFNPNVNSDLQSPGVSILGNFGINTKEIVGKFAWQWHHDKDFLPETDNLDMNALYVVMLYGVEIPPEGIDKQPHTTAFLDMIEAYNNLPHEYQQQLELMSMYHLPPRTYLPGDNVPMKLHPIVSTHQVTKKKGLYLGSDTSILVGMEDKLNLAKEFWQELFQIVLKSTPIYNHVWKPNDLVMWDNSQVMHAGIPYDSGKYKRVALRVGVVDKV